MPLIYPPHDARRADPRLYKGGDGGVGQMRADEEERQRKVQEAVDVINRRFGVASSGPSRAGAAPDRTKFYRAMTPQEAAAGAPSAAATLDPVTRMRMFGVGSGDSLGGGMGAGGAPDGSGGGAGSNMILDEAAFNKAVSEWEARANAPDGEAEANKAARESMYADISGAVRDTALRDLDRQFSQASNRNLFGLARSGLLGGSVDAESGGDLKTRYGEGRIKATQAGQQAGADLRVSDERTRQNLIQLAQSGLDTGTAASMAASQMGAAAELAKSQAAGATVGRLFDDMTQAYVAGQVARARNPAAGQQQPSSYGYGGFAPSRYTGTVQR